MLPEVADLMTQVHSLVKSLHTLPMRMKIIN